MRYNPKQLPLLMDWTAILHAAGISDSPGREDAIAAAKIKTAERYARQKAVESKDKK